jgi:hypothetical protein
VTARQQERDDEHRWAHAEEGRERHEPFTRPASHAITDWRARPLVQVTGGG